MNIFLGIIAVLLVVGVWAIYFQVRAFREGVVATYDRDANVFANTVKYLLVMIWMRLAEPSEGGLAPAFNQDQSVVPIILDEAQRHKHLLEERDTLRRRTNLDEEEKRRLEELERSIRWAEGNQTSEDEAGSGIR